ncbi:copper resistance protein CopC [Saccharibacillus sp. CPCC 101409]|uniref:copper resistance protein CopC n=1 Tax=Saccharibacillus sp. CPCC 101409 TaxID=3058041 RepID=UPI00267207FA|nr:copper resistance protein CopC [Saccharibacillus sp. CPCC 101409]MDO3411766.1 copper resistance protein CopC [Saccharibacillus sp. CPCC 101409]
MPLRPSFIRSKCLPVLLAILTAAALLLPGTASAHATLVSSNPADQASAAEMPQTIELTYNEPIQGEFLSIEVTNTSGDKMPVGEAAVSPDDSHVVQAPTEGEFPDGVYTLNWRVVSADGHPIRGTLRFGIGAEGALTDAGVAGGEADYTPGADTVAQRALLYTSFSLIAGSMLFLAFLLPAELRGNRKIARPARIWFWVALAAALLIVLIGLPLQAKVFADVPWSEAFGKEILRQTLQGTSSGKMFLMQILLILLIGGAVVVNDLMDWGKRGGHWTIAIIGFVLLLVTKAVTGHAAGSEHVFLQVMADTLHLLGASVWVGGLLMLLLALPAAAGGGPPFWKTAFRRFAPWALASVAALIVSGVIMSAAHVPSWADLFTSRYGLLIVAKAALLLVMGALGAVHFRRARRESTRRGTLSLAAELAAGVVVLALAGLLTNVPTPQPAAAAPSAFSASQPAEGLDNVNIALDVRPLQVGQSTFAVRFTDGEGAPLDDWQQVTLRIAPQAAPGDATEVQTERGEDGGYTASGLYFGSPGVWNVQVHGLSESFEQADRLFEMEVK